MPYLLLSLLDGLPVLRRREMAIQTAARREASTASLLRAHVAVRIRDIGSDENVQPLVVHGAHVNQVFLLAPGDLDDVSLDRRNVFVFGLVTWCADDELYFHN